MMMMIFGGHCRGCSQACRAHNDAVSGTQDEPMKLDEPMQGATSCGRVCGDEVELSDLRRLLVEPCISHGKAHVNIRKPLPSRRFCEDFRAKRLGRCSLLASFGPPLRLKLADSESEKGQVVALARMLELVDSKSLRSRLLRPCIIV